MADRDRYDWERGREPGRDYGRGTDRDREFERNRGFDRDRGYQDRGAISRGADEVRSWFGDDEARRRREMDEQRDRPWSDRDRDLGANSPRTRAEHAWNDESQRRDWDYGHTSRSAYGDQRDFVGRSNDWSGSRPYDRGGSHWTGGSHDYGDEDTRRRFGGWQYSGGFAAGQPSSSYGSGYGAGSYESGNYRGEGWRGESGFNPQSSREWNAGSTTGEGRWSGGQMSYPGAAYGSYGTGMFAGRGPRNYQRSDDRIREDVNERLTIDPRIDASDIDVRVQNGEVTLSGLVDDRRTRRLAEEIIEDLPGVRDVRNDIRVHHGQDWRHQDDRHREIGEQSRGREDGSIGNTGDPQKRDDVTIVSPKETKR
jgi:osmotically-inducible protein OsmY